MNSQAVRKVAALFLVVLMSAAGVACGEDNETNTGTMTPGNNTTSNSAAGDAGADVVNDAVVDAAGSDATDADDGADAEDGDETDVGGADADFDAGDAGEDGGDATLEPRDGDDMPGDEDGGEEDAGDVDSGGGPTMEICGNMSFTGGNETPIDDDGDGDANCEDDECLSEMAATSDCYDSEDEPNLVPGESYLGAIGPADAMPPGEMDVDTYPMYPMDIAGKNLEFKVVTHNANTLIPCIALIGEGESGDSTALDSAEGDGVTPVTLTKQFASGAGYGNRIEVSDCRNDDSNLPASASNGGPKFTYTLSVTEK